MSQLNPSLQRIIIGGGLSQFDGFCQRLADLSLPVVRPPQMETTSQGLAFLLFQCLDRRSGQQTDNEHRASLDNSRIFIPQDNPGLKQRYQQWRQAMESHRQHD